MRFKVKSFFSINRFHIFLMLLMICILMLFIEAIFPRSLSNHLLNKKALNFFNRPSELDDDLQRLKDYEAEDFQTTPKLPFGLEEFGDYEPVFLAHKVIHLDRKMNKNERHYFTNVKEMREKLMKNRKDLETILGKDFQKKYLELIKKQGQNGNHLIDLINERMQNKSFINRPSSSSTSAYLFDNESSSSKQAIIKRHMLTSLNLASDEKKSLKLNNLERIAHNVKQLNEQNPLSILKFAPKEITKINRIYILSYFRSGSSFLGDLLQQHFRTFYQFEPLHFRSVASRLPANDTKSDASIALVLHMINECNFHGKATTNYLNWISKENNKFLLTWNRFLYSLCKYNQSKCSDEKFVEQVCNLSEQRVTKFTRVNLGDLIRVLNKDNSFEEYVKHYLKLNSSIQNVNSINYKSIKHLTDSVDNTQTTNFNSNNQLKSFNEQIAPTEQTNNSTNSVNTSITTHDQLMIEVEPIKIIYLVRDPRAIYSSRQYLSWCKNRVSCASIESLCKEMNQDFQTFENLNFKFKQNSNVLTLTNSTRYPIQLFLVRFETIAFDPFNSSSLLFKLLNLPFTNNIKRFVYTHTNSANQEGKSMFKTTFKKWYLNKVQQDPHSTKRNSTKIPFEWIHKLSWSKIDEIQTKCRPSMEKLGYKAITNEQFKNVPKNLTELLFNLFTRESKLTLF